MPYRVAHVATERTWRGGEQQVFSLIDGLAQRGHWNLAVVRPDGELSRRLGERPQFAVSPWGEWDLIEARRLRRNLLAEKIDLVHAHTGHAVSLAALATLGTRIPMLLTRRVDFPLATHPFSRWKYRRAARIIAISNGVRDVLRQSGVPPEKIDLVPSGIDFRRLAHLRPVARREFGWEDDVVIVGQVAALAPHKDQATFLRALAVLQPKNRRLRAVLVGDGELRAPLESLCRSLNLSEVVRFEGFRSNPLDYLSAFDLFCLSSREEGLGTSILDAFALRVPVVATRTGGIPDLVEEGVTGFLASPQNPASLAAAMERCLASGSNLAGVLDCAEARAREFDVIHTVASVEAVYNNLLELKETTL